MTELQIDLVYFDGCLHADRAREHLKTALGTAGHPWREWNLSELGTPDRFRRFGSPTILVNGRDVAGGGEPEEGGGMACRAAGAPPVATIKDALLRRASPEP